MNPHDDRAKIEGLLQWLHVSNPDCKLDVPSIQVVLQKLQTQLLLDIRDVAYEISRNQGIDKWGAKLIIEPPKSRTETTIDAQPPEIPVIGSTS